MSNKQRRHGRFSLDIPARLYNKFGERQDTLLQQISIGGCFTGWEENIYPSDEFRLEIELPNKNRLPLHCKAIYRFEDTGIGVRFLDVTRFEQDLIASIIVHRLELEGVPADIDAFTRPAQFADDGKAFDEMDERERKEFLLDRIMAGDE